MAEKTWSALPSCKKQCYKEKDRLNQLPDELLLLIMSFLTMKEVARTSVLSHRWKYLWQRFPVLFFEDSSSMKRMYENYDSIPEERSNFLRWVNQVLEAHLGQSIDEFRVSFDLDKDYQSEMDSWVVFALTKQVKRLEINFTPLLGMSHDRFPKWRMSVDPLRMTGFKSGLRSLCLKYVNVTSKEIACVLRSCLVLENLCIHDSKPLRYIRALHAPLQLKHLELSCCRRLETINILAPKLLSFYLYGYVENLHIRNASLLSEVSIGELFMQRDFVVYTVDSFSQYFSQLRHLCWWLRLCDYRVGQPNLGIKNPPAITNLRHLELNVLATPDQSLLGWVDLIEASPLLQRLTVNFRILRKFATTAVPSLPIPEKVGCNGRPLKSLKTLELSGHIGHPIDLEFATYVIKKSVMLKDVIVEILPFGPSLPCVIGVDDQVANLMRIVPHDVNLTLKVEDQYK